MVGGIPQDIQSTMSGSGDGGGVDEFPAYCREMECKRCDVDGYVVVESEIGLCQCGYCESVVPKPWKNRSTWDKLFPVYWANAGSTPRLNLLFEFSLAVVLLLGAVFMQNLSFASGGELPQLVLSLTMIASSVYLVLWSIRKYRYAIRLSRRTAPVRVSEASRYPQHSD